MDKEREEKSLFETAAETLGSKKHKKKEVEGPRQPVPDKDVTKRKESIIPKIPPDNETQEMIAKIRTMQADLQSRFDVLYKKSGKTPEQLMEYLNNPKNFLPKDWEFIQKHKQVLENRVWDVVGEELKPVKNKIRTRANLDDERKGKTLGARKKWLPMR